MYDALPFYILCGGSLLASVTSVFLPDTTDAKLPETVEEADLFGRGQKFFAVPFFERRRARRRKMLEAENQGDKV